MADLDVTGAEEIMSLHEQLHAVDVDLWLVRLHGEAQSTAEKAGVIAAIGADNVLPTIRVAGQAFRARTSDDADGSDGDAE
jgi:hypothetical protein